MGYVLDTADLPVENRAEAVREAMMYAAGAPPDVLAETLPTASRPASGAASPQ